MTTMDSYEVDTGDDDHDATEVSQRRASSTGGNDGVAFQCPQSSSLSCRSVGGVGLTDAKMIRNHGEIMMPMLMRTLKLQRVFLNGHG